MEAFFLIFVSVAVCLFYRKLSRGVQELAEVRRLLHEAVYPTPPEERDPEETEALAKEKALAVRNRIEVQKAVELLSKTNKPGSA